MSPREIDTYMREARRMRSDCVTCDVLGEGYRPPRRPCRMVTRGLSFDFTSFCVTRRTLQFCSIAR